MDFPPFSCFLLVVFQDFVHIKCNNFGKCSAWCVGFVSLLVQLYQRAAVDAEGDLRLGLENYCHCAHTGALSDSLSANATNLTCAAHKDATQWVLHPTQAHRATSRLCCHFLFWFVLFVCFSNADVPEYFCCLQMRPKKIKKKILMSRRPLTVKLTVVVNHFPSHCSWVCLLFEPTIFLKFHFIILFLVVMPHFSKCAHHLAFLKLSSNHRHSTRQQ